MRGKPKSVAMSKSISVSLPLYRQLCEIPLDEVRRFAHCASAVMAEARVDHLDSRVMLSAAKNTLLDAENKRLTLIDFDVAQLYGFPRTDQLVNRQYRPQNYGELLTEFYMEVCGPPL